MSKWNISHSVNNGQQQPIPRVTHSNKAESRLIAILLRALVSMFNTNSLYTAQLAQPNLTTAPFLLHLLSSPSLKTNMPIPPSHADIPPFPPPSTFSILPDIYLLIARLSIYQQAQQTASQAQSQTQAQSDSQTQPQTQPPQAPQPAQNLGPPLDIIELPAQVYPIKQRIAKARAAVAALPDVDRSVEEQEHEIHELQRTVALLKARLGKLGAIAAGAHNEADPKPDVVMDGVEE